LWGLKTSKNDHFPGIKCHNSVKLLTNSQTKYTKIFLGIWATTFIKLSLAKSPVIGPKNSIFVKNPVKKSEYFERCANNFLLKRKLSRGISIKVEEQSLTFQMSGQQSLKKIPTRRYAQNTKKIFF